MSVSIRSYFRTNLIIQILHGYAEAIKHRIRVILHNVRLINKICNLFYVLEKV